MKRAVAVAVMGGIFLLGAPASSALADTFEVNAVDDTFDGSCDDLLTGNCTLREAITLANGSVDTSDEISTEIPGPGPHTIALASVLPTVTTGLSLTGALETEGEIIIDGNDAVSDGLLFLGSGASNADVSALTFTGFPAIAIGVSGGANDANVTFVDIEGSGSGIYVETSTGAEIFGNTLSGVSTGTGSGIFAASSTTIEGNEISGYANGIFVSGSDAVIGDFVPEVGPANENDIHDNDVGILVDSGSDNLIGANFIHDNDTIGIDLAPTPGNADGVTPNDNVLDADAGANGLQNFPVIDTASVLDGLATVTGTLPAAGGTPKIDVYVSDECSPSGNGEGAQWIGTATIGPDESGENESWEAKNDNLFFGLVEAGDFLTATAENGAGTSEFGPCLEAIGPPSIEAKEVVAGPVSGTVRIKLPGGGFEDFDEQAQIPEGSILDTTDGEVRIISEAEEGETREGIVSDGEFKLTQEDEAPFLTVSTLTGGESCPGKPKKVKRRALNFRGKGGHKNNGKHGSGTVRGTEFLTEDLCSEATKFSVREGSVKVRDFAKKKNVVVDAGDSYVAKKKKKKN